MAIYEITIKAKFECAESDTDEHSDKAIKALEALGFTDVDEDDLDEQDYELDEAQVLDQFKELILPSVVAQYGADDSIAIREEFNNWTDQLCKDGQITDWQYENIDNPY